MPHLHRFPWACLPLAATLQAAEPVALPEALPRVPPTTAASAAATFQIRPGFTARLLAAEPLVADPIALDVDETGHAYVVEMRDYSERRPERLGRIRRLTDTNGDGIFDSASLFLEQLPWPTAVVCWDGGVFVGTTPDVLYAKDTNGDGQADLREVVFTGLASEFAPYATNRLNVQALVNSFRWGLDQRFHASASLSGGSLVMVDSAFTRSWRAKAGQSATNPASINLRGKDFSWDPRTLDLRPETGGGQHGMSFDDHGRRFVCSNSDHLQQILFDDTLPAPSDEPLPAARVSIAADGPAAPVFRRSPDEPWRVLRTRWRVAGLVSGPVEGGGRPSGYFTGATGATIYRGDAYGPEYAGHAFIADCGSNLIHRKRLRQGPDGLEWVAERDPSEATSEFLASTDNWFRPVQFYNGPDGCLWVLDMYREVIEHPWSLPEGLKRHLDLNSGNDRGRLWRIQSTGFDAARARGRIDGFATANVAQLVGWLAHANGWHRETAARLLHTRQDPAAIPLLREVVANNPSALARQHALRVLQGMQALTADTWTRASRDADPDVRAQAATLVTSAPGATTDAWKALAGDASARVRLEVALRVHHSPAEARLEVLEHLLTAGPDRVVRLAIRGVTPADLALWRRLELRKEVPLSTRTEVARVLGRRAKPEDLGEVLGQLDASAPGLNLAWALGEGAAAAGRRLRDLDRDQRLTPLRAIARQELEKAGSGSPTGTTPASTELLVAAIRFTALDDPAEALPRLAVILGSPRPEPVTAAGWQALGGIIHPDWARTLGRLLGPDPALRPRVVPLLLRRTDGQGEVLDAVADGRLRVTDLPADAVQRLRQAGTPERRARARDLLGEPPADRRAVLDQFLPALNLKGDPARGATVFRERCAGCHRLREQGQALGPDLASVAANGPEKLLVSILDPNREVSPNYLAWTAETAEGETTTGLLGSESAGSVTLRLAGGTEVTVPKAKLKAFRAEGRSLMPEGLETGLDPQAMADLLAALTGQ